MQPQDTARCRSCLQQPPLLAYSCTPSCHTVPPYYIPSTHPTPPHIIFILLPLCESRVLPTYVSPLRITSPYVSCRPSVVRPSIPPPRVMLPFRIMCPPTPLCRTPIFRPLHAYIVPYLHITSSLPTPAISCCISVLRRPPPLCHTSEFRPPPPPCCGVPPDSVSPIPLRLEPLYSVLYSPPSQDVTSVFRPLYSPRVSPPYSVPSMTLHSGL